MAGDWIKMRCDLASDPAVIQIASILNIEEDSVVGKLHKIWSWADSHTPDGNAVGVTLSFIDRYISVSGFAQAMISSGWLLAENDRISFPNFDKHMGESAKKRAMTALRVKRYRNASANGVGVTKTLPEKRREEKSKEPPYPLTLDQLPESLRSESFLKLWTRWLRHRSEIRKPIKPTQQESQLAKLAAFGLERSVAMIEYTIAMGWQGLREEENRVAGPEQDRTHARMPTKEEWLSDER